MATREMGLGSVGPARGHVGAEKVAAKWQAFSPVHVAGAGERAGGLGQLKMAAHLCDRIGRPLSTAEMELATLEPARGHAEVERMGKHR